MLGGANRLREAFRCLGQGRGGFDHKHPLLKPIEGIKGNKIKALSLLTCFKRK